MKKKHLKKQLKEAMEHIAALKPLDLHVYGSAKFVDRSGEPLSCGRLYILQSDIEIISQSALHVISRGQRVTILGFELTGKTQSVTIKSVNDKLSTITLVKIEFTKESFEEHGKYEIDVLPEILL
jgi:hypothetical protein